VHQKLTEQLELYEQMVSDRKDQMSEIQHQIKDFQRENKRLREENEILNSTIEDGQTEMVELGNRHNII
jgi:regulator of replication initiation timing